MLRILKIYKLRSANPILNSNPSPNPKPKPNLKSLWIYKISSASSQNAPNSAQLSHTSVAQSYVSGRQPHFWPYWKE